MACAWQQLSKLTFSKLFKKQHLRRSVLPRQALPRNCTKRKSKWTYEIRKQTRQFANSENSWTKVFWRFLRQQNTSTKIWMWWNTYCPQQALLRNILTLRLLIRTSTSKSSRTRLCSRNCVTVAWCREQSHTSSSKPSKPKTWCVYCWSIVTTKTLLFWLNNWTRRSCSVQFMKTGARLCWDTRLNPKKTLKSYSTRSSQLLLKN